MKPRKEPKTGNNADVPVGAEALAELIARLADQASASDDSAGYLARWDDARAKFFPVESADMTRALDAVRAFIVARTADTPATSAPPGDDRGLLASLGIEPIAKLPRVGNGRPRSQVAPSPTRSSALPTVADLFDAARHATRTRRENAHYDKLLSQLVAQSSTQADIIFSTMVDDAVRWLSDTTDDERNTETFYRLKYASDILQHVLQVNKRFQAS